MIKYICPGYIALATWTGQVYSNRIPVDLWAEWSTVSGDIRSTLLPTKGTEPGERWEAELRINRSGPADRLLYITFFSEDGQPVHRYTDAGTVFQADAGTTVHVNLGGR